MLFEISNPCDPYTMEAERFDVACAACLFLGSGQCGLREVDGQQEMPCFVFGGSIPWFKEKFGGDLGPFIYQNMAAIAECLGSVLIGNPQARKAYLDGLALIPDAEGKQAWKESWHNRRRTGLLDIGARAWQLADLLRKKTLSSTCVVEGTDRDVISTEQALELLADGETVKTARVGGSMLIAADWERTEIEAWIRSHEVELTGPEASGRGFGMAGRDECGWLFIRTKEVDDARTSE
jgi:hypothetical protein